MLKYPTNKKQNLGKPLVSGKKVKAKAPIKTKVSKGYMLSSDGVMKY